MKKGKLKPYEKKKKSGNKFMIYVAIGVMVFSGLYYGLGYGEIGGSTQQEGSLKITQYTVVQAGDDVVVGIADERPELIAMLGEKALGRLSQEMVSGVMNITVSSVYAIDGEASNSYVFFRFYTNSVDNAVKELTPKLDSILGDYKLYRGYTGIIVGDQSMQSQVYLLGYLNYTKNSAVKIMLLEKSSGEKKLGYIGFIKSAIPAGPVVESQINSIEGYVASGLTEGVLDLNKVNESIPSQKGLNYQTPLFVVEGQINQSVLSLEGVEIQSWENSTLVSPSSATMEAVAARLEELNLGYTTRQGVFTMTLSLDENLNSVEERLSELRVTNVTFQKYGSVQLPKEVLVENTIIPIDNYKNFSALLFKNATAGEKIKIGLIVIKFEDQAMINARQV